MLATVGTSRSIGASLNYNENEKKGGEIILSSGIDPKMPVKTQIKYIENMSNPRFKVKGHTIVLSHGKKDSQKLTPKQEVFFLKEFLSNLEKRGVDLDSAPWIAARHNNTGCTHFHIFISNTCYDGTRFKSDFLGQRACRAAADVSLKFGLEVPERGARAVRNSSFQVSSNGQVQIAPSTKDKLKKAGKKKVDRKKAIEQANARKQKYAELKEIIMEKCSAVTKAGALTKAEQVFLSKECKHLYNDMSVGELYNLCTRQGGQTRGYFFIRNNERYELYKDKSFVDYEHMPKVEAEKLFTEKKNDMLGLILKHGKDNFMKELSKRDVSKVMFNLFMDLLFHPERFLLDVLLTLPLMAVGDTLNIMMKTTHDVCNSLQHDRGMHL